MKTQALSALDTPGGFDVCIVGSGPAGQAGGSRVMSYNCAVRPLIQELGQW
jgi:hypothetical protein